MLSWEIYIILLCGGFLRFYRLDTSIFNYDQAAIFSMAYNAWHYGLLPATSNAASVGIANPPGVVYLLMIPAAFSASPVGGAILVSFLTTMAIVLTYIFVRRYYGRLTAAFTTILYATATSPLHYGRFIWQQNMLAPFIVLFMFALFWGAVERRKGWFIPALALFGLSIQLHATSVYLLGPFVVAILLAPKTIRPRDYLLGACALLILFSTYAVWEMYTHFADVAILRNSGDHHLHVDTTALTFYQNMLIPYTQPPTYPHSLGLAFVRFTSWLRRAMPLLLVGGWATLLFLLIRSALPVFHSWGTDNSRLRRFLTMWSALQNNSRLCGLLLLLTWQFVPLLGLSIHSLPIYFYYLLVTLPGSFLLVGLFLTQIYQALQKVKFPQLSYGVYLLVILLASAQMLNSTAEIVDVARGNFDGRGTQGFFYFTDIGSLEHAIATTDSLAARYHVRHVYIPVDFPTRLSLPYMAEQLHTPVTLFDDTSCLVLPDSTQGPALYLVTPYAEMTTAMLKQFTTATPVGSSPILGGKPFSLYLVTPRPVPVSSQVFRGQLQFADVQKLHTAAPIQNNVTADIAQDYLVSRWKFLHSASPAVYTTYNYSFSASLQQGNTSLSLPTSQCSFSAIQSGEQLLTAFPVSTASLLLASVATLKVQTFTSSPYFPALGPIHLETNGMVQTPTVSLSTPSGEESIDTRIQ